jgi:hypothetical protein
MNRREQLLFASTLSILLPGAVNGAPRKPAPGSAWEIGPVINGRNHSIAASRPSAFGGGWGFTISQASEPHYVTFRHGSLRGKRQIRMRFRVEGQAGAIVHGAKCPIASPSAVTLYFQRAGDDWTTDGARWWATFASARLDGPVGETEIVASLDGKWTSVLNMTAANNPNEFAAAKAQADRVGFTFGNCTGFGHGARATAPMRFVVTRFQIL